jgi:DNA-binding NarL/FixJ family response regulator
MEKVLIRDCFPAREPGLARHARTRHTHSNRDKNSGEAEQVLKGLLIAPNDRASEDMKEDARMSADIPRIRILTVDDHPVVRQGIAGLLGVQPDMVLVGEASNGREAIEQFRAQRPDVTLMDLQMPEMNGIDALIAIRSEFPDAKIIVLTTYVGDVQILRALKAGAHAYLLKNTLHKELLDAIRAVHAGKKSLSPEASYEIADHSTDDALTPAEMLVLRLIADGNANKQIADQLSITEETVKSRVKCILSKLGANDRTHAAMIGLKRGIIEQ